MSVRFNWRAGFDPNLILSKIAKDRKVDQGRTSFSGDYYYWIPVLNSAIQAQGVDERLKSTCIQKAISDAALKLNDKDSFLAHCQRSAASLSTRSKSRFILFSTVTYTGPKLIDWIGAEDFRIYWAPSATNAFMQKALKARASLAFKRTHLRIPNDGSILSPVLAHVSAHDAFDAFEIANDRVDRFRGLLNMLINSTNRTHPLAELAQPHAVNRFRRGPFHTIHNVDGSLANQTFWYEPRWEHVTPTVKFADDGFGGLLRGWWRMLHSSPMKDLICDALVQYCRALDMHEADTSLLGMWQVLEKLTDTDKYDQLIHRVVRLFRDPEDARQIANHLRTRRNQTAHSSHNIGKEAHVILNQAERIAGQALFFYLKMGSKFKDQREVCEFLDLSLDQTKLGRQQELSKLFIEYQNRP